MTNGDLLRKMTNEELAERFGFQECVDSRYGYECPGFPKEDCCTACRIYFLEWLKQEVSEDDKR